MEPGDGRRRRIWQWVSVFLTAGLLTACQNPRKIVVTDKNNHASLTLEHGELLIVQLPAPGSDDMEWVATQNNVSRLRPDGIQLKIDPDTRQRTQIFRFQALDRGSTFLELKYRQTTGIPRKGPPAPLYQLKADIR